MGDPLSIGLAVASIIGAGATTYSSVEANKSAKEQQRAQEKALKLQEEEALKKGPEATAISEEDTDVAEARKRLLRKGFLATLKTGESGLGTAAATGGTGLKGTLG